MRAKTGDAPRIEIRFKKAHHHRSRYHSSIHPSVHPPPSPDRASLPSQSSFPTGAPRGTSPAPTSTSRASTSTDPSLGTRWSSPPKPAASWARSTRSARWITSPARCRRSSSTSTSAGWTIPSPWRPRRRYERRRRRGEGMGMAAAADEREGGTRRRRLKRSPRAAPSSSSPRGGKPQGRIHATVHIPHIHPGRRTARWTRKEDGIARWRTRGRRGRKSQTRRRPNRRRRPRRLPREGTDRRRRRVARAREIMASSRWRSGSGLRWTRPWTPPPRVATTLWRRHPPISPNTSRRRRPIRSRRGGENPRRPNE